jgi:NAD(P)-dependent dehydrogenase (short-subunit alcohol dehydrogenase family)
MVLRGRRAVVTGAGRGIGATVAHALAAEGAAVTLCARTLEEIAGVAEEIRRNGHRAEAIECDVSHADEISSMARRAIDWMGGVDILVNNAGVAPSAPLKRIRLQEWEQVFAVNVTGTFLCTQALIPGMIDAGWGRVVNIASIASKIGHPYIAAYAASKHAVLGFTRAIAAEVAKTGVTVNAVCPGYVDTPMTAASVERIIAKTSISEEDALEFMRSASPQGRLMDAAEIAYLTVCLCDERARGINGQGIVIDGGGVQS